MRKSNSSLILHPSSAFSMPEMPHGREYHGDAMFIGSPDNLFIAHTAAGLDNICYTRFSSGINPITEREKSIRSKHRPANLEERLLNCNFRRINTGHLAGADTDRLITITENNGIRFDMLADPPGEIKRLVFRSG